MYGKANYAHSETFFARKQNTSVFSDVKFGKKLSITIASMIIIVAIIAAFLLPQGSAIIHLNVNYALGEKMVYETAITRVFQI